MKSSTEVVDYAVANIDPSPYQARKRFREEGIAELAESVREHGVIQPVVARVSPKDPNRLELVAGERRLRAAKLAGLLEVGVIIRSLSDRAAEEMMLIENLQREDLSAREEADGYDRMLRMKDDDGKPLYTAETLAAKIGKPVSHVRDRLKVRRCPEAMLDAVERGDIAISVAMLVGRIPDTKAREQASGEVLKPQEQVPPLNYVQTLELIRAKYMLKIDKADFEPEDSALVPERTDEDGLRCFGGACGDCPFRSGNLEGVEMGQAATGVRGGKGGFDPNVCTMPSCYRAKMDAAWKMERAKLAEQGAKVIDGAEAKKVFGGYGGRLTYDSPFAEVTAKPEYGDIGNAAYEVSKNWKSLIKGSDVPVVIARHPVTGKRVELVERKPAAAVVKAKLKGKVDPVADEETAKEVERLKAERAKELLKAKIEKRAISDGVKAVVDAVHSKGVDADGLSVMFEMALERGGSDGKTWFGQWLEIKLPKGGHNSGRDYEKHIIEHVKQRAETPAAWHAFIFVALMAHGLKWGHENELKAMAKRYDVDLKAIEKRCAEELKPKPKKEAKAKPGKASTDKVDWSADQVADVTAAADKRDRADRIDPVGGVKLKDKVDRHVDAAIEQLDAQEFDKQVAAIAAGTKKIADFIGPSPLRSGTPDEFKVWNAKRMALDRAAKKRLK